MLLYPIHQSIGQINGTMFYATEKTRSYVIGNIIFMIFSVLTTIIVLAPKTFNTRFESWLRGCCTETCFITVNSSKPIFLVFIQNI